MRIYRDNAGDSVTSVPLARWDASTSIPGMPNGSQFPRFGSFLTGVDGFDGLTFGIGASEASTMDPQQRLLLQASLASLLNAGHGTTGVFAEFQTSSNHQFRQIMAMLPSAVSQP